MRLFSVVLFIIFNIYLIESKSNRTEGEAEKLIRFRGDKNENGFEGNVEEKGDEVAYEEEYEYSDDGTLVDNNILKREDKFGGNSTAQSSPLSGGGGGGNGESFPNEVFLSLRNITADAATAFRSFTNKNADLLASASDNLNVTFNDTFHDGESGGINRALRDTGHPSEVIALAEISPTYQPFTHKKIDTAELSDCALQGEWKPMGIAHQHIKVESDGGSQHEQVDLLQSVGSYSVPSKIVPYWQNSFAYGGGGGKVPQNHKPYVGQGSLSNYGGSYSGAYGGLYGGGYGGSHGVTTGGAFGGSYGSAYGYGGYDSNGETAGLVQLHSNSGFSSAGQFQKIKSSNMLSPPPYPPLVIGKKPGFYKSQKSKHKYYNNKKPRPSGYSIGGNGFSNFGASSYASDVKGGSFGGYLNLNSGGGLGGGHSLGSGSFKQGGGGISGNLYGGGGYSGNIYGNGGGSFGLNQYGSGGNIGNVELYLSGSNSGKAGGQVGVKVVEVGGGGGAGKGGGEGFSVFAHNGNIGSTHTFIKDLLHYGNGVGGKGGSGSGGTQVLSHQGEGNGGGAEVGINLVETSHVDLLHPGNQELGVTGLIQEDDNNKVVSSIDIINHSPSPSADILHHGNSGTQSAYTQDVSASNVNVGHSAGVVQSASSGGASLSLQQSNFGSIGHSGGHGGGGSLSLQQDSFGSISHSGGIDLLHPGGIAIVTGRPQSSPLQSGELISASTISPNSNYGIVSSDNKDTGLGLGPGLSSGFKKGVASANLITSATTSFNHGSNIDAGTGHLVLSTSGIGQVGHSGSSYLTSNLGQLNHGIGEGEKLIPDPSYLKSYYGQSTRGGNSLSDSAFLSSQISQGFHYHGQDPSTFTCGKNHDQNTNYHTATFQVADNDHPSSVDVLQYEGDAAVLIKAESAPFHDKILPERKNYNSIEAEPSSEIISQTAPLSASVEQEAGQTENEPTKAEDDEEPEHKSYYHEVTKVTKIPATSVGNIQYTYSEYETKPQTFSQETEINKEEQETERPQIIKELEQLTNKFQLDPDNPQKLFEDPPPPTTQNVNYPIQKDEHHHEEAERYHYTSHDYTVKNQAHDFVTEFPNPPVQLIYKKPYVKYFSRPAGGPQKPKTAYFPTNVPANVLRKQKPVQFSKNQNYKVQEAGGERHRHIGEIFPTQKTPKQFYNPKPNFAVEVPKVGFPKGSKSGYQVNFSNGKVIKKITTSNRQKTLGPVLVQKHAKLPPPLIRVVKISV